MSRIVSREICRCWRRALNRRNSGVRESFANKEEPFAELSLDERLVHRLLKTAYAARLLAWAKSVSGSRALLLLFLRTRSRAASGSKDK